MKKQTKAKAFDLIEEAINDSSLSDGGKLWAIRFVIDSTKEPKPVTEEMVEWAKQVQRELNNEN